MGDLVNLKRARKTKVRQADAVRAAEQRLLHGRTKAEKLEEKARRAALERHVEGHRRDEKE